MPDQVFNSVEVMAFSADGRRLACGHPNGRALFIVDTLTHKELWHVGFPTDLPGVDYAKGIAFSVDGQRIAHYSAHAGSGGLVVGWNSFIQVVDAETGQQMKRVVAPPAADSATPKSRMCTICAIP